MFLPLLDFLTWNGFLFGCWLPLAFPISPNNPSRSIQVHLECTIMTHYSLKYLIHTSTFLADSSGTALQHLNYLSVSFVLLPKPTISNKNPDFLNYFDINILLFCPSKHFYKGTLMLTQYVMPTAFGLHVLCRYLFVCCELSITTSIYLYAL